MRITAIAAASFFCACGVLSAQAPMFQQIQKNTIIAVVKNVDTVEKTVIVMDTWGRAAEFSLGGNASIRSSAHELRTVSDLKPERQIQISYDGTDDNPRDITITILPGQE